MPASLSQVLGMMRAIIRPELPTLFMEDETPLWNRIGGPRKGLPEYKKAKGDAANARPYEVPLKLLNGFKFFTGQPDGGPLQRGSGPTIDKGTLVPVFIYQAAEWTKATEINTNSEKKAIENYATMMAQDQLGVFHQRLDALLNTDGSFTLDTVVSTAANQLTVNNANMFDDNLDIDCWSALQAGGFLGTVTINSVDGPSKQLNLTGAVPGGVGAGTLLLVNGAPGVSNSGLFGIEYYQVQAAAGSVMNVQRSAYPGKLSTPHVAAVGNNLTPAVARRIEGQMIAALGVQTAENAKLLAHMGTDMAAQWEFVTQGPATVILNQIKGDSMPDPVKPKTPKTFMGHEIVRSAHAKAQRIDLLHLESYFKIESQPIDYFEIGGQTDFALYGGNGAPVQSTANWLWMGAQIGCENVRKGAYADGFAATPGF